jgi:hypothetical protein
MLKAKGEKKEMSYQFYILPFLPYDRSGPKGTK